MDGIEVVKAEVCAKEGGIEGVLEGIEDGVIDGVCAVDASDGLCEGIALGSHELGTLLGS